MRALVLVPWLLACGPSPAAPTVVPHPGNSARIEARIGALEQRIDALERAGEREPVVAGASLGWSCMAKCGERDRQTTEFHVQYRRVTGQGASAAAAYQAMIDACDGTLYERIEDERFVGAEMRNVCLADAPAR
jgi:hypothetical protein